MSLELTQGHLYRLHSRNLPYGVYDGNQGFIGIREKFYYLFLFTEFDADQRGTARALEDLGPIPATTTISEESKELFEFLADAEAKHGRGQGYGLRPGDPNPRDDEDEEEPE